MLAIDTNLVVRYLTADHPAQSIQSRTLIEGNEVFVSTTVLMEAEWVLRSVYGFPATQFDKAMRAFAGLPTVTLEDPKLANEALAWMGGGMDFADAIHLARGADHDGFVTFDRRLVDIAKKLGIAKVREP